jgi:acyl-homoserine lactone acylase PvdQ
MHRIAGCRIVRCCVLLVVGLAEAGVLMGQTTDSEGTESTRLKAAAIMEQARRVLPQLDGRVSIRGLEQPVEILRDRWGIAHIYAQNSHDLFLAQGYSMAMDRLFQVDLWRRIGREKRPNCLVRRVFRPIALPGC